MKKQIKGQFGYLSYTRKKQIIITIVLFAVSFSLLFGGWMLVHTKKNLLTIVAVLGMLPACKFLVTSILYLRAHGTGEETYRALKSYEEKLPLYFDLYFTTEKKSFPVEAMVVHGKTICFYMKGATDHCQGCQKHLESIFVQNGFKGYTIKGFDQLDKFTNRLDSLTNLEMEETDPFVLETLMNISL